MIAMSTRPTRPRGSATGRLLTALRAGYEARVSRIGNEPGWSEMFGTTSYSSQMLAYNRHVTMSFFQSGLLATAEAAHVRAEMYEENGVLKFKCSTVFGSVAPQTKPTQTYCSQTYTCTASSISLKCVLDGTGTCEELTRDQIILFLHQIRDVWGQLYS